ncbi:MAG: hypothetical protein ACQETL_09400 [Bacteroidota bacterium]
MGALPVFHQVLFFLSVLFGMNMPIVGQEAIIEINLSENTASLTYQKLITSNETVSEAQSAMKKLNEIEGSEQGNMQLVDKSFYVEQDNLNLKVNFDYGNSQEHKMLEFFGFNKNNKEEIVFELLDNETYIASNGKKLSDLVKWSENDSIIKLEIKAKVLDEHEQDSKVNLAEHWNDKTE